MSTSKRTSVQGVFLSIFGVGTLIIGDSGVGKSDLALSLVDRGHVFIADDLIEIWQDQDHRWMGCSPRLSKNLLAARGLGIVDLTWLFGAQAVLEEAPISLVIHLKNASRSMQESMVLQKESWAISNDISVYTLPISSDRPKEVLIESCVKLYQLSRSGKDAHHEFVYKHHQVLDAV